MKKALLFSFIIALLISTAAYAYETIIIDFPAKTKWEVAYYKKINSEAILQYVPEGQTAEVWTQTIIVHSYNGSVKSAIQLSNTLIAQLVKHNPTGKYRYFKQSAVDTISTRLTNDFNGIKGHGEILRATKAAEGMLTIQYIDRNKEHFKQNFNTWLKIIRDARTYNGYWANDRVLNKDESFEL